MSSALLDSIIENMGGASVVGEQHDTNNINYGGDDAVSRVSGSRPSGSWDASEYGISLEEAQRRWDDAQTPEAKAKVVADLKAKALRRAGLDTSKGRVAMMAAGQLPWHGLGVLVDKATTSAEAIKFAGLDWLVAKTQLYYEANGIKMPAPDTFGIVRQDTGAMLGSVGKVYKPIQNSEGFDFLDGVLEQFGAKYETAGSLYGGKQVWMLAHLPQQAFVVNGGDAIEPYVIFTNCHDGSGAAYAYPTSVRVVCANTFRVSKGGRSKGIGIRHTGNVKNKINAGQEALGMAVESFSEFKEAAEVLYKKPLPIKNYANDVLDACLEITQADMAKGVDALAASIAVTEAGMELASKSIERKIARRGEILSDILDRYESERCGIGSIRGTAWAAFNAVTEHADHSTMGRQSANKELRMSRRFESVISGEADAMKQSAFEIAMRA